MKNSPYSEPGSGWSPGSEGLAPVKKKNLVQAWFALTSLEEPPLTASFAKREQGRQAIMTSSVLFFYLVMIVGLLPACWVSGYTNYFWLCLGLLIATGIGLAFNRYGHTIIAGTVVTATSFATLTIALFLTVPFTDLTLQGYDMYVIVELLAVALLPARNVFIVTMASIIVIVSTLFVIPHTATLTNDIHTSLPLILMRPIGTIFMVAGVAFIISSRMKKAIKSAGQAEAIAKLEHEIVEQNRDLEQGLKVMLQTHVAVANGNLSARAPLEQHHKLWQIAQALNTLLVRYQRAAQTEQNIQQLEHAIDGTVRHLQQAERARQPLTLPPTGTFLDRLFTVLQGRTIAQLPLHQKNPFSPPPLPPHDSSKPFGTPR